MILYTRKRRTAPICKFGGEDLSIASDLIRGSTDTIILAHLLDGDSYAYEINKSIRQKSSGQFEFKEATLYTAFRRLEQSGCISSYWGDEETGARRRYYTITAIGRNMFYQNQKEWEHAKGLIDSLVRIGEDSYGKQDQ